LNIEDYYLKVKSGQGVKGFKPFRYQKEVAEAILNGENVILQAPTGAGKTLASIMPFIIANEENMNFPKKLIYSTPRRTLVNSLYEDIKDEIDEGKFDGSYNVTIQTGEKKEDRYFNGDIIFTTFDQSLSSALSMPISLSNRLGNINVAAVLSSYLIFDEFHLFDLEASYTTTVLMLEKLKDKVPFCIMTATISEEKIDYLADKLDAKVIRADKPEYLKDIVTQKGKERRVFIEENSLDAEKIIKLHNQIGTTTDDSSKKSIVMCNRVDNAQKIYEGIKKLAGNEVDDILLIHSRFLDKDRKEKEDKIKRYFPKDNKESNVILVSTQVIEVGIDITSHIMHTEISTVDSFLQRIGRCARYRNEKGEVYVYDVLNEGDRKYLPYNEEATLKTFEALKEINGNILTPELSQKIIDRVYSEETDIDAKANQRIEGTRNKFIKESWKLPDKKRFKDLIRDVVGCNIIIHPWIWDKCSPYNFESLSLSPWTLRKEVKEIRTETEDWLVKEVIERADDSEVKYTYQTIEADNIYPNNLYILNPNYFAYDERRGLLFNQSGNEFKMLSKENRELSYDEEYKEESYLEHIERMKEELPQLEREMSHAINLVKENFDLSDQNFKNIVEFTIWAHDLGKLQKGWQLAHQREKHDFVAHAKRTQKPPSHAGESFGIVLCLLEDFVFDYLAKDENIIDIVGKTIVSHHSLNIKGTVKYKITKKAINYLSNINRDFFIADELIEFINARGVDQRGIVDLLDDIRVIKTEQYLFYFILVRLLRLSDQRATKKLNEEV